MKIACEGSPLLTAMSTQAATMPISSSALITCWPGTASGRVGIRSWSLAKAMFEPQKETEPTTAAKRTGIRVSSGIVLAERDPVADLRPGDQRHGAAADAVVEGDHLRHLGHLHADRGDRRRPRCRSRGRATIRPQLPIPSSSSVVTTATAMPTAATRLPCLAVVGWVPRLTPMMKSEKATM